MSAQRKWRTGMGRIVCIAVALTLGAGGVRNAGAQSRGAGDPWAYVADTTLVRRICIALARVDAGQNALDSVLASPARSAVPQFNEMFAAMDALDAAWDALVMDYSKGNTELRRAGVVEAAFADQVEKRCPNVGKPPAK
jgi:hypothetical protein